MKYSITIIIILALFSCKNSKNIIIYNKNKMYNYKAFFIQNNDTITSEKIIVQPKGHKWIWDRSQMACNYFYFMDSTGYKKITNPVNSYQLNNEKWKEIKINKGEEFYGVWSKKESTGVDEGLSYIWIHPFRNNQYIYTEVAPFPQIELNSMEKDCTWVDTITMFSSFDNFAGTCSSTFKIIGKMEYKYEDILLDDCLKIKAVAHHSKLGDSYLDYIFHPKYGFVEMKYTFYDGTRIDFYMYKVTDKKNKK